MKKFFEKMRTYSDSLKGVESRKGKVSRFTMGFLAFNIVNKIGVFIANPIILFFSDDDLKIVFMVIFSLFLRFFLIKPYDHMKIDWFSIENLKEKRSIGKSLSKEETQKLMIKIINFILKFGGRFILIIALIPIDPSITVIYQRKGYYKWNGIRGWFTKIIFVISTIACAYVSKIWIEPVLKILLRAMN